MIIFHNPGVIDLEAIRLMGASVKKPGSFGRFGTGLKYAIASVLRGGGSLELYIDRQRYTFETRTAKVKEEDFEEVLLVEQAEEGPLTPIELGFTTQLGKDWKPWMVLRELGCNARDEGGDLTLWEDENWGPSGEGTEFTLVWPELEDEWESSLDELFLPTGLEPLEELEGVRIYPGPGKHVYHRGVRIMELPKESAFRYDIVEKVDLTEDRTARYSFIVEEHVRRAVLSSEDPGIVAGAVTNRDGWENSLKWNDETWRKPRPGMVWLEEVGRLREVHKTLTEGVVKLYLLHRAVKEGKSFFGGYRKEETPSALEVALEELEELHFVVRGENIYVVDELPSSSLSMSSDKNIYVSAELLVRRPYEIARELLIRSLESASGGDHDTLLEKVLEPILQNSDLLLRDKQLMEEEKGPKT